MGLHIRPGRTEQFLGPLDCQFFNGINVLTAAVVTLAGKTFGVLVGENRALSLHDGSGGEIFAGDQLQVGFLALLLLLNQGCDRGIGGRKAVVD